MVCNCPCGNSYAFEPLGLWVCHRCGAMNDSGAPGSKHDGPLDPDRVDELVWEGKEFAGRADASARAHPDSWVAWYSLGAAYGARGNVLEAGLMWTRACREVTDDMLGPFIDRCVAQMSECICRGVLAGDRCNIPYAKGLEMVCIRRLDGRSFCLEVYERVLGRVAGPMPHEAFSLLNIGSAVVMQGISLHPDIRDHRDILVRMVGLAERPLEARTVSPMRKAAIRKTSEYISNQMSACRMAIEAIGSAVDGRDDIQGLAEAQPSDGTAGFAEMLSKAVSKGSEIAYMRATKASEEDIASAESEMRECIRGYVSMFTGGDPAPIPENRVYEGR